MGVITIFSEYVLYESLIVAKIAHLTHEILTLLFQNGIVKELLLSAKK